MRRNTPIYTNNQRQQSQSQQQPYQQAGLLPVYQRLLTPTTQSPEFYPYQTPSSRSEVLHPGMFLIDKGRKSISIAGAGANLSTQTHHHVPPSPSERRRIMFDPSDPSPGHASGLCKNLQAPGAYNLLVQVLGEEAKSKSQARVSLNVAENTEPRDLRVKPGNAQPMQRLNTADYQKPIYTSAYTEHANGHVSRQTDSASESGRSRSPSTQRSSRVANSRQDETPKRAGASTTNSESASRKRTHESAHMPKPKVDTSNPTYKLLDRFSEAVWQHYENSKQNTQRLYMKENLRQNLERIAHEKFPGSMLFLVGSSLNGFATHNSDTDLCLMISTKEVNQKNHATYILNVLHRLLLQRSRFVTEAIVIHAKVPILKFVCSKTYSGLECDININNATGIRNTHLQQIYSKLDWRVAPLIIILKQWASSQGINDASQGTLSSYSLVLMMVNYLQVRCKPCVLPCLHQEYSSTFNSQSDVRYLYDTHPSNPLPSFINCRSTNTQTLWELLCGFFAYYVNEFNFHNSVICVRLGTTYPLSRATYTTRDWSNKFIYIEEPFDRNNTARAVYTDTNFSKIMRKFAATHRKLANSSESDSPEELLDLRLKGQSADTMHASKKKKK